MGDILHVISVILGLIALFCAYRIKKYFGRIYSKSFAWVILAIFYFTGSHFIELFSDHHISMLYEHILFYLAMISLIISFIVLFNSLKITSKDSLEKSDST